MFMHNFIKIFKKFQEIGPVSLFFRIWTSATPRPIPNDIWQSLGSYILSISMCMQSFITIVHSVRPFSLFFRIWSSAHPRPMLNVILQSLGLDLAIPLYIIIIISILVSCFPQPRVGLQILMLGKASTDDKRHFAIPWARSCQYQCVCKILSKYSKRFKS